ncbi:MAG: LysR family transcriptional regulator [Osedax symbiont Rs2]|nr:MAG: LysR family transcriptional regulator [Osedax symbiont Rs2]
MGMSKSAISQQLKRLEEDIGQQLLSRHTRGMSLTAAGEKLLGRCELLRDQVELAIEELDSSREAPSGIFALTIPHSCEKDVVVPALSQLCKEFPLIQPQIHVTDNALDLIQNKLDVAIYGGELKDSNYRALPVGSAREIFCATPTYVQKHGLPSQLQQLQEHQLIATSWQKSPLALYSNHDLTVKITLEVKFFANTNTLPSALEMALHDMGIVLLPEFTIQSALASGQLVRVLPEYQGWQWPFYLVHRFQREKPIHITRFYQLVKHFFAKANANV